MAEAQHFYMAADNYTDSKYIAGSQNMDHGDVYNKHDIEADGKTVTVFYARGDRDASAGTEGNITYKADNGEWIKFSWDIPWGASHSHCEVTCSDGITVSPGNWQGDAIIRQTVMITINDKHSRH